MGLGRNPSRAGVLFWPESTLADFIWALGMDSRPSGGLFNGKVWCMKASSGEVEFKGLWERELSDQRGESLWFGDLSRGTVAAEGLATDIGRGTPAGRRFMPGIGEFVPSATFPSCRPSA